MNGSMIDIAVRTTGTIKEVNLVFTIVSVVAGLAMLLGVGLFIYAYFKEKTREKSRYIKFKREKGVKFKRRR